MKILLLSLLGFSIISCTSSPPAEDLEAPSAAEAQRVKNEQEAAAEETVTETASHETEHDEGKEPVEDLQPQIISTGFLEPPDSRSFPSAVFLSDSTIESIAEPDTTDYLREEEAPEFRLYWRDGEQPEDDGLSFFTASENREGQDDLQNPVQRPHKKNDISQRAGDSQSSSAGKTIARAEDRKASAPAEPRSSAASSAAASPASSTEASPEATPEAGGGNKNGRDVWALPGDTVDLFFPGRGWVYDRSRSRADGVEFQERFYDEERTEFIFRVFREGFYHLVFSRENMRTGESEREVISLRCSAEGKPEYPDGEGTVLQESARRAGDAIPAGPEELSQALAARDISYLLSHYDYLLQAAGGRGDEVSTAAGSEYNGGEAQAFQGPLSPPSTELLVEAAEVLLEGRQENESLGILLAAVKNGSLEARDLEEVYYLLGKIYESPGPIRDEAVAIGYYRRVVENFPAGEYWYRAKERISYLERHYLQVR